MLNKKNCFFQLGKDLPCAKPSRKIYLFKIKITNKHVHNCLDIKSLGYKTLYLLFNIH